MEIKLWIKTQFLHLKKWILKAIKITIAIFQTFHLTLNIIQAVLIKNVTLAVMTIFLILALQISQTAHGDHAITDLATHAITDQANHATMDVRHATIDLVCLVMIYANHVTTVHATHAITDLARLVQANLVLINHALTVHASLVDQIAHADQIAGIALTRKMIAHAKPLHA